MKRNLLDIDFGPELRKGAYKTLNVCSRLKHGQRLTLITDENTIGIASDLMHEIQKIGLEYWILGLED